MTPSERRKFILAHHPDWKVGRERNFMNAIEGGPKYLYYYYIENDGKRLLEGYCDEFSEWLIIKDIKDASNQKTHF